MASERSTILEGFGSSQGSLQLGQHPGFSPSPSSSVIYFSPALERRESLGNPRGNCKADHKLNGDMGRDLVAGLGALLLVAAGALFVLDTVGAWGILLVGALVGLAFGKGNSRTRD